MTALQEPPVLAPPVLEEFEDVPRRLSALTVDDVASLIGSFFGSLALVWVCFEQMLAFSGVVGFVVCWWIVFTLMYMGVTALSNPWPAVKDRAAATVVTSGALIVAAVLVWVIAYTVYRGWPALHHLNFFTSNMSGVRPTDPLTKGGVFFAMVGTGEQVAIATAISVPLGLGTAIYLAEIGGRLAQVVRTVVEAMTALPDILAGLFIYTFLILQLHWQRDGLAVAIALSVTMTPIVARSAEVVLRVVPAGLREASWALGASNWGTVWRVVLPTARSGLATSLILGVARVAGETAPLLIVDQETTFWNADPRTQPQESLPLFIYQAKTSGETNFISRGYGAATILLTLVLVLFVVARLISRDRIRGGKSRFAPGGRGPRPPEVDTMTPLPPALPGEELPMGTELPDLPDVPEERGPDDTGPLEPVGSPLHEAPLANPDQPIAPPPPQQHTPYWASQIPAQAAPPSEPTSVSQWGTP